MPVEADTLDLQPRKSTSAGVDWPPVTGAFAASAVVHGLVAAAIGAILTRAPAAVVPEIVALPIQVQIVDAKPVQTPPPVPILVAKAPSPAPKVHIPPLAPPVPAPAPWATEPRNPDPPASFLDPPMVTDGITYLDAGNLATLGADIERRINAGFPGEPNTEVTLNPPGVLGYPLDLIARGIEGRVLVWFGVDEQGNVVDREALDGPPELMDWVLPRLDRVVAGPARDANGNGVRGWVALEIDFSRDAAEAARAMRAAEADRLERAAARAEARGEATK